jgi:WD40 repeat protein
MCELENEIIKINDDAIESAINDNNDLSLKNLLQSKNYIVTDEFIETFKKYYNDEIYNEDELNILLNGGMHYCTKNPNGYNFLHIAIDIESESIVKKILSEKYCNNIINVQPSHSKQTPLHFAIENGNNNIIKILLNNKNINMYIKEGNGMTPLQMTKWRLDHRKTTFKDTFTGSDEKYIEIFNKDKECFEILKNFQIKYENKKNVNIKDPNDIINTYLWKDLADHTRFEDFLDICSISNQIVKTIYNDFGNWCIKKNYMIGDNDSTKIFWLDNILKYLCYENPYVKSFNGHSNKITNIVKLKSGNIVSSSNDNSLRVWDLENETSNIIGYHNSSITSMDYFGYIGKESDTVITSSEDNTVRVWRINEKGNNKCTTFNYNNPIWINNPIWNIKRLNNIMMCYCGGGVISLRNLQNGTIRKFPMDDLEKENCIVPMGVNIFNIYTFMSKGSNDSIHIWDIKNKNHRVIQGNSNPNYRNKDYEGLLIKINDNKIAYSINNKNICVYDLNEKTRHMFKGHQVLITSLIKLNETTLISGDENGSLFSWKLDTNESVFLGKRNRSIQNILRMNDNIFISGSLDDYLILWNLERGTISYLDIECNANSTLFKYDENTFFSGSWGSTICMWNIKQYLHKDHMEDGFENLKSDEVNITTICNQLKRTLNNPEGMNSVAHTDANESTEKRQRLE